MILKENSGLDFLGGVPERSKGSDCKSDGSAFEGSNPSPSIQETELRFKNSKSFNECGMLFEPVIEFAVGDIVEAFRVL